jgi:hypothetical protein
MNGSGNREDAYLLHGAPVHGPSLVSSLLYMPLFFPSGESALTETFEWAFRFEDMINKNYTELLRC